MSATIESDAAAAWDASFDLNFYTDATFTTEFNNGKILNTS